MNNLTLARFVQPIDSRNMGRYLREDLTLSKTFPQVLLSQLPINSRESEGLCSEAWVQGLAPGLSGARRQP